MSPCHVLRRVVLSVVALVAATLLVAPPTAQASPADKTDRVGDRLATAQVVTVRPSVALRLKRCVLARDFDGRTAVRVRRCVVANKASVLRSTGLAPSGCSGLSESLAAHARGRRGSTHGNEKTA